MLSAKASVVPEASLKTADSPEDVVKWLRRFYFEDVNKAKERGHRGGAICLLDKKVAQIRSGKFERRGIKRTALILPAVVSFDEVGESPVLYKWLDAESFKRKLLFRHGDVRPITVIGPEEYEALMAVRARGDSVCRVLLVKTESRNKLRKMDDFLYNDCETQGALELPWIKESFQTLMTRALARIQPAHEGAERVGGDVGNPSPTT